MKLREDPTESNKLLRETISSLSDNELPPWWRSRVGKVVGERFEKYSTSQYFEITDELLIESRRRKKSMSIASRSSRAFVCPIIT